MLLDSLHHTPPKSAAEHASRLILANRKVYDALTPGSKRLLIWQTQPALQ